MAVGAVPLVVALASDQKPRRWATQVVPKVALASVGAIDPARTPHADALRRYVTTPTMARIPFPRLRRRKRSAPSTRRRVSGGGAAGPGRPYRQCVPWRAALSIPRAVGPPKAYPLPQEATGASWRGLLGWRSGDFVGGGET
jgi:hypothetical protein